MNKIITIDSTKGGNGDVWMRLVGFYVVSKIVSSISFRVCVPPFIYTLANHAFGDRLQIVSGNKVDIDLTYTSLGLKDLLQPILKGHRFISPYQRSVFRDKKKRQLKDYINVVIFYVLDWLGVVQVPDWDSISKYQGYLDIIGIKKIRTVTYENFIEQLEKDYNTIIDKFNENYPVSIELKIPSELKESIIIYPNGTSRQFIPLWWAVKYLPDAYYAFFYKDSDANDFINANLKVVYFYKEPGDIIKLSQSAKWTITTDSFPSHLLQYASKKCTVLITEVLKSRIVTPVFKGKVIDSEVSCHPCLHLERKGNPLCQAGHLECFNWNNNVYNKNILSSIK